MDQYMLLKKKLLKLDYYKDRYEFLIYKHEYDEEELVLYWKCLKCECGVTTNCEDCLFDAFLWACVCNQLPILKTMYEAGYRVAHQEEKNNALFWACIRGNLNVVKWLHSKYNFDHTTLTLCKYASDEANLTKVNEFFCKLCRKIYNKLHKNKE